MLDLRTPSDRCKESRSVEFAQLVVPWMWEEANHTLPLSSHVVRGSKPYTAIAFLCGVQS